MESQLLHLFSLNGPHHADLLRKPVLPLCRVYSATLTR